MIKTLYKKIVPYVVRVKILDFLLEQKVKLPLKIAKVVFVFSPTRISHLFKRPKTILCLPYKPTKTLYAFYKIAYLLNCKITDNPKDHFNCMMDWEDTTLRLRNQQDLNIFKSFGCINMHCLNIDKEYISKVFEKVFGYSVTIDPLTFQGYVVKKSKFNARHDGVIIRSPVEKYEEEAVYQKVINNEFKEDLVYDIRVPVFEDKIPFVYYKYRYKNNRFKDYIKADVVKQVEKVFSLEEIYKILLFSREIGMQYGELDVLRDKDDGKIYIVDANNTPVGPRSERMALKDFYYAVTQLAITFNKVFLAFRKTIQSLPEGFRNYGNFLLENPR